MRKLVFGEDNEFLVPFGVVPVPFTAPNHLGLEDWQLTYDSGSGSCMVHTLPGNATLRLLNVSS
jgi:hypothetical protein